MGHFATDNIIGTQECLLSLADSFAKLKQISTLKLNFNR